MLEAGCGFVNCIPVFIAREDYWNKRFKKAGLPIVGDDIKSQVGATIVHRALARLFHDRGVKLMRTSQLNVGGNMDFYNMLERERLESKKISKTNAVTSIMGHTLPADDVHVGPSDYVPWLTDRKWAHIRLEGQAFGDVPLNAELKLEVWDSPELGRHRDRRGALLQAGAQQRPLRPARRPELVPDEVADAPASRRRGARADRGVHRQVRAQAGSAQPKRRQPGQGREATGAAYAAPCQTAPCRRAPRDRAGDAVRLGGARTRSTSTSRASPTSSRGRGHRVLIVAPSESSRAGARQPAGAPRRARGAARARRATSRCVLGVGEVLPFSPTRRRAASLPVDVARTIEEALERAAARRRPRARAVRAERLERRRCATRAR